MSGVTDVLGCTMLYGCVTVGSGAYFWSGYSSSVVLVWSKLSVRDSVAPSEVCDLSCGEVCYLDDSGECACVSVCRLGLFRT